MNRISPGVSVRELHESFYAGDVVWALHFAMLRVRAPGDDLLKAERPFYYERMEPMIATFVERLKQTDWFVHELDELVIWRIVRMYREYGPGPARQTAIELCRDIAQRNPEDAADWYYKRALVDRDIGEIHEDGPLPYMISLFTNRCIEIERWINEVHDAAA